MYDIYLDIETTGLDLLTAEPIQIYAEAHIDGKIACRDTLDLYVKAEKLHPKITEITGITWEFLQERGTFYELACSDWNNFVWRNKPARLIGYNIINFDLPILQNFLQRHNPNRFKHPPLLEVVDVMHHGSVFLGTNKWPKLADLAAELGIEFEADKLHNAKWDVKLTQLVYLGMRTRGV